MPRAWPWFALAAGIVVADQVAKWLIQAWFVPGERLELTGFLNLVLVFNRGAAFRFLAAARWRLASERGELALLLKAVIIAAHKHRDQRRKDPEAAHFINHPIALADV